MKDLKISKEISFPRDIVTQTIAILAKRRAGKSYTMRKLCEELLENNEQLIMVDPKGDQWGIRSSADGKKPGYPIIILGGEHGDVPLEVNAGEMVAKLAVEEQVSILLDLSIFRKHEIATFMTAFLENLYRLKAKEEYRTPVMLVIDEADAIAPQKPQQNEARMLGAAEDIVRRGGQRGIGCALITQRSAVLNKNVLTQAQMLIVLRTIAPQDLAAMKAWIDVHGSIEEGKMLMDSLPSLPIGDAWFWSPGWPTEAGIFKRAHVLPIKTFDSGATPKPGEKKIVPKNLADINLDSLKKQMAATIEKAKNDDPKLLKKRIAELEKLQTKGISLDSELHKKSIEIALTEQERTFQKERKHLILCIEERDKKLQKINQISGSNFEIRNISVPEGFNVIKVNPVFTEESMQNAKKLMDDQSIKPGMTFAKKTDYVDVNGNKPLRAGAMKMLNWLSGASPEGLSKQRLATLSGFAVSGGTFNTYISELKRNGWITGTDILVITKEGEQNATPETIPNGEELLQLWKSKFRAGAGSILEYVFKTSSTSKEEIGSILNFEITGGTFNTYLSELKRNGLIKVEGNIVSIADEFN